MQEKVFAIVKRNIYLEIFTDIHVSALLNAELDFLGTPAACMYSCLARVWRVRYILFIFDI
jgi:hypothetical protein